MEERSREITVGAVILLAITVLILGLLWLGNYRLGRVQYKVEALFADGAGLKEGDPVTVAGVTKGKVKKIRLERDQVRVILAVDSDVTLYNDARAMILDAGMMGEKRVALEPGRKEEKFDRSKPLPGVRMGGLTETVQDLGILASEVGELVRLLRKNVVNEETVASLRKTLTHAEKLSEELGNMMGENREDLRVILKNFKKSSQELGEVGSLLDRFNRVAVRLDTLTNKIEKGEGTLGQLLQDRELYETLKKTAQDVDALVKDIKENPQRYIQLKIF